MHDVTHICLAFTCISVATLRILSHLEHHPGQLSPVPIRLAACLAWNIHLGKEKKGKKEEPDCLLKVASLCNSCRKLFLGAGRPLRRMQNISLARFKNYDKIPYHDSNIMSSWLHGICSDGLNAACLLRCGASSHTRRNQAHLAKRFLRYAEAPNFQTVRGGMQPSSQVPEDI